MADTADILRASTEVHARLLGGFQWDDLANIVQ
jgi:hypothetical protein